jgi:drug/metabolite transporter (DMT)-like permease
MPISLPTGKPASTVMVIVAFAILYIVWGSTYFFIRVAIRDFPPMLLGSLRYVIAGFLLLLWCFLRGERLFVWKDIRPAVISGLLLLLLGNGILIWSEQYLASSLAAILLASGPLWFVILDKRNWKENFHSKETLIGLVIGFIGVILLFIEKLMRSMHATDDKWALVALGALIIASVCWAAGSLYAKYNSTGPSNSVNAGWQMMAAGIAFIPVSLLRGEAADFHFHTVSTSSWLSLFYLVTMGSLAGYSAFIWLLQVRSATQVSTHAYVNPVVAVLLGMFFTHDADEKMSSLQILGLVIILLSVLLVNLAKYRKEFRSRAPKTEPAG